MQDFGTVLAHSTGPEAFAEQLTSEVYADEASVFKGSGQSYVIAELRDWGLTDSKLDVSSIETDDLVTVADIKGIVHNHSTYSDGIHSLDDMATYCQEQGFAYLVMSDHSQYAGYANGLKADRVSAQQQEIDAINARYTDFKVFKSIECDILPSGELDYTEQVLQSFDLLVCSVHAGLKMSQPKAMERLTRAIASPYCHILGHMTGRLLLSRQGYPVDHREIIDLCSEYNVAIELNANPYRLDMDWRYIPYAMEKGVSISINPDAHSREAIHYIEWGVASARKGGLTADACLNTRDLSSFQAWVDNLPSRS
jgi:DNA polymerase (family 10)